MPADHVVSMSTRLGRQRVELLAEKAVHWVVDGKAPAKGRAEYGGDDALVEMGEERRHIKWLTVEGRKGLWLGCTGM